MNRRSAIVLPNLLTTELSSRSEEAFSGVNSIR
jgi:hypothetical protein